MLELLFATIFNSLALLELNIVIAKILIPNSFIAISSSLKSGESLFKTLSRSQNWI